MPEILEIGGISEEGRNGVMRGDCFLQLAAGKSFGGGVF